MRRRLTAFLIACLLPAYAWNAVASPGRADSVATTASWTSLPPPARIDAPAAYDPKRQRLIIFGGWEGSRSFETWAFSFNGQPRWDRLASDDGAPQIVNGFLLYDPPRDRVLLLFGYHSTEVWSFPLGGPPRWSEIQVEGKPPAASGQPVYDALRDRVLALGTGSYRDSLNDGLYALVFQDRDHARWERLTYDLPHALRRRVRFGAIYDVLDDRLVLFGGGIPPFGCFDLGACIHPMNDTWSLDLRASKVEWTEIDLVGDLPSPRVDPSAAYDAAGNQLVTYGGQGGFDQAVGDSWVLSLGRHPEWKKLPADLGPRPPDRESVAWDGEQRRLLRCGGITPPKHASVFTNLGEVEATVYELSVEGDREWESIDLRDPVPSARNGHTLTYDPVDHLWILFGGTESDSGKVWTLSDQGGHSWRALQVRGEEPPPRAFHSAVFDSATKSLVVFGGLDMRTTAVLGDVWRLSLADPPAWTRLEPAGTPPSPRAYHGALDDPVGHRMIVYGGRVLGSANADELWQLDLGSQPAWSKLEVSGQTPGSHARISFLYDSRRHRALLLGGTSDDVWSLALTDPPQWMPMPTEGGVFTRSDGAALDVEGDRVLVLDGSHQNQPWELRLSATSVWRKIPVSGPVPSSRTSPIACNSRGDEVVLFGGGAATLSLSDLWIMSLPRNDASRAPLRIEAVTPLVSGISFPSPYPNPSRSNVSFAYTQPASAHVKISVFDGAGRLVSTLFDGEGEAGSHEVSWNGLKQAGSRARAGVYYCSMTIGAQTLSRRFVLISP